MRKPALSISTSEFEAFHTGPPLTPRLRGQWTFRLGTAAMSGDPAFDTETFVTSATHTTFAGACALARKTAKWRRAYRISLHSLKGD